MYVGGDRWGVDGADFLCESVHGCGADHEVVCGGDFGGIGEFARGGDWGVYRRDGGEFCDDVCRGAHCDDGGVYDIDCGVNH